MAWPSTQPVLPFIGTPKSRGFPWGERISMGTRQRVNGPQIKDLPLQRACRSVYEWRAHAVTRARGLPFWWTVSSVDMSENKFTVTVLQNPAIGRAQFWKVLESLRNIWWAQEILEVESDVCTDHFAEEHFYCPPTTNPGHSIAATIEVPLRHLDSDERYLIRLLHRIWSMPELISKQDEDAVRIVRVDDRLWIEILFGIHPEHRTLSDLIGPLRGLRYPSSRLVRVEDPDQPRKFIARVPVDELKSLDQRSSPGPSK